jgi:exopolysaccharide biosynthesis protein
MRPYSWYPLILLACIGYSQTGMAQMQWQNVDSLYQPLPSSMHVYKTTSLIDGKPNIAYYVEANLQDKSLDFTTDTSYKRRLSPAAFYQKNRQPLLVMNTTFFSFATNQNLSVVIKNGQLLSYNVHTIHARGKDTFTYRHPLAGAIGINKRRKADVAWLYTDSSLHYAMAAQQPVTPFRDSVSNINFRYFKKHLAANPNGTDASDLFHKWKVQTAVGGGPVLLQNGQIAVSNNEELKFAGKAIEDKHPRSAMGYAADGKLIFLAVQGRFPNIAEGATLVQEAQLLKELGCIEALNLDGGGSSCLLINGRETITPSDKEGQRPVPAVFIIRQKR